MTRRATGAPAASCSTPARPRATSTRAESQGWLPLLALDRLVAPGRPSHDVAAVAALADCDEDAVAPPVARGRLSGRSRRVSSCSPTPTSTRRACCSQGAFARRSDFATVLRHVRGDQLVDGAGRGGAWPRLRRHGSRLARAGRRRRVDRAGRSSTTSTANDLAALLVYVGAAPAARRGVAPPESRRRLPTSRSRSASPISPATRRSAQSSTPSASPSSSGRGRRSRTTPSRSSAAGS